MSFFEEFKRRNVFRVGIAYVISAWVLMQFMDLVLASLPTTYCSQIGSMLAYANESHRKVHA